MEITKLAQVHAVAFGEQRRQFLAQDGQNRLDIRLTNSGRMASYITTPPPFGLQPPPPQSRDAGYGFSIAWTGRKGEELGDFVFVRLYRGGVDGDFRKIA